MARNRKRRNPRPNSPQSNGSRANGDGGRAAAEEARVPASVGAAAAGSPESDLADAQAALGRPELADVVEPEELEELGLDEEAEDGHAEVATRHKGHVEHRESLPVRFAGFVRGSWLELQRVQWPDRRQVFQATGVVVGFVIVAGVFLGVADLVASKLVNLILQ